MPFPAFLSRASRCQKEFGIYIATGHRSKEVKPIRVVIVGGGFAAVQFAKTLRSKLRASDCEILLFNRENHMVFHPLLADVAGASINADAAATPLRQMLPGVGCRTERVQRIDLPSSEIEFDDGTGALQRLHYDHVVIACGAENKLKPPAIPIGGAGISVSSSWERASAASKSPEKSTNWFAAALAFTATSKRKTLLSRWSIPRTTSCPKWPRRWASSPERRWKKPASASC